MRSGIGGGGVRMAALNGGGGRRRINIGGQKCQLLHRQWTAVYGIPVATCCCLYIPLSWGGEQQQSRSRNSSSSSSSDNEAVLSIHRAHRQQAPDPCPLLTVWQHTREQRRSTLCTGGSRQMHCGRRGGWATAHGTLWWCVSDTNRGGASATQAPAEPPAARAVRATRSEWRRRRSRSAGGHGRRHAGSRWTRVPSLVVAAPVVRHCTAATIRREALAPSF